MGVISECAPGHAGRERAMRSEGRPEPGNRRSAKPGEKAGGGTGRLPGRLSCGPQPMPCGGAPIVPSARRVRSGPDRKSGGPPGGLRSSRRKRRDALRETCCNLMLRSGRNPGRTGGGRSRINGRGGRSGTRNPGRHGRHKSGDRTGRRISCGRKRAASEAEARENAAARAPAMPVGERQGGSEKPHGVGSPASREGRPSFRHPCDNRLHRSVPSFALRLSPYSAGPPLLTASCLSLPPRKPVHAGPGRGPPVHAGPPRLTTQSEYRRIRIRRQVPYTSIRAASIRSPCHATKRISRHARMLTERKIVKCSCGHTSIAVERRGTARPAAQSPGPKT
jgi:hypothetical protein